MAQTQNQEPAARAGGAGAGARQQNPATRGRVVLLNALPLNALPRSHLRIDVIPVAINDLVAWSQRRAAEGYELVHFIRHPATIQALMSVGIPLSEATNSGLYTYQPGDIIVVVSLRNPPRGQEVQQVSISDLEAWVVAVL